MHATAPVAAGIVLACHCCSSQHCTPPPAPPPPQEPVVMIQARAEEPAPIVDEFGQPVVVRLPVQKDEKAASSTQPSGG